MTCTHCEELQSELARLKGEAPYDQHITRDDLLRHAYPEMAPSEVRMCLAMYDAEGRPVDGYALSEVVSNRDPMSLADFTSNVKVHIHRLRNSLGSAAVENVWGAGYRLSQHGRQLVSEALVGRAA